MCKCICVRVYMYVCTCLKSVLLNCPSKGFEKDSCGQGKRQKWNGLVIILVSSDFQNRTYLAHLTGLLYGPSLPCVIWRMKFRMVKWLEDHTVTKEWMSLTLWPSPSHFLPTPPQSTSLSYPGSPFPPILPTPLPSPSHIYWRCNRVTGVASWNYTPHFPSSGPRVQAHEHVCQKQLAADQIIAMINKQPSALATLLRKGSWASPESLLEMWYPDSPLDPL